ncbi:hypothetical protein [Serinicoccus marinus]|uniref:hypothetical protein n=1 Tax=Serinicoccus marinus TaxID=247333 RepID=UPI00122E2B28|nr:hypothetical protein [Serinicoccus marinus]
MATAHRSQRRGSNNFIVVPNAHNPRLLVPANNPRAAAAAMRRFSAGLSARETIQRLGASAVLRMAGSAVFRDRVIVSSGKESLASHLAAILGYDVDVSIGVGPARANRKPVLEVFDRGGRSVAYVKVGDSESAERNVRGEAAALERISGRLDPMLEVPSVLHSGTWHGMFILVMSSLRTSFRQRPKRQWNLPTEAMNALAGAFAEGSRPLTETPLWGRMTEAVDGLSDTALRDDLHSAFAKLADRVGTRLLAIGAWHGDWTPWNMSRCEDRIQLWDWERFESGVPAGLDSFHYGVNAVTRIEGSTPQAVRAGLKLSDKDESSVLAGIYLASITCRYAVSAQDDFGHLVKPRALLMQRSLMDWLDRQPADTLK